jgi:dTDP-4-dehydrorhamnose reductase
MGIDCVFSGIKGLYTEVDVSDATGLYGRTKYLDEVDSLHAITLLTSIIGHELDDANSLIGWFLAQVGGIKGYRQAIFSSLPIRFANPVCQQWKWPSLSATMLSHTLN